AVVIGSSVPAAGAQGGGDEDAANALARRHAPVVMLAAQEEPCDPDGEPFQPMAVDALLENPEVALRQVGDGNPVVKWGPSARDLFGLGSGFFLDFPGSALEP